MADTPATASIDTSFMDPAAQDDPFAAYAETHERCPVYRLPETGMVMVAKYDDVRTGKTDPPILSSQPSGGAGRQTDIANGAARAHQELFGFFLRPMKRLPPSFTTGGAS